MDHCVCTCSVNVLHLTCWLCTAGGCGVFILHGAWWLYSIRRRTKCVVIHFLLAQTKLAIWLTRTHRVCGSGPIDPLHCSSFSPSGQNISYMWVKDSVWNSCVWCYMSMLTTCTDTEEVFTVEFRFVFVFFKAVQQLFVPTRLSV